MSDLISRQDAIDTVEELNRKVNEGTVYGTICTSDVLRRINALPSAEVVLQTPQTYGKSINPNTEIVSDLISRQAAIDAICKDWCNTTHKDCKTPFNQEIDECYHCDGCGDVETLLALPSADRPTGECRTCGRNADNGGVHEDGRTKCPIQEHYALLLDGYCHLYEPYNCGAKMGGDSDG